MPELTDDQLDGLFRKSAEEFEPPFDPAAWQDMNARLNTRDRTDATGNTALLKKLLRWGLPLLLLLLFVGGWYGIDRADSMSEVTAFSSKSDAAPKLALTDQRVRDNAHLADSEQKTLQLESANPKMKARQKQNPSVRLPESEAVAVKRVSELKPAANDVDKTEKPAERAATRVDETNTPEKIAEIQRTTSFNNPASTQKRTRRERGISSISADKSVNLSVENLNKKGVGRTDAPIRQYRKKLANQALKNGLERKDLVATNSSSSHKGVAIESGRGQSETLNIENSLTALETETPTAVALPMLARLSSKPPVWVHPVPLTEHPVTLPAEENTARRVTSQPVETGRGLSIRFVVSPDLSAVGLKNFTRPGTNVGLLLEYRLATRWSVQAGVMQSTKVYKAATSDYALPDYVTNWMVQPYGVDGTCNMIDIPLNIRYDIALRPRQNGQAPSRWFVSGGVTSYIMKQENYVYQYADPTSPHIYPKNRGWSGKTGAYGFSELNLSAGYERAISRRFSWQVEPYLKVPLKGVGYYKINLLSTGAFFSLRYKF